jgi:Mlc titration factor MtfA (ptsG expression regulator)
MFDFWKKRRRAELRAKPFPAALWELVEENVPYVRGLSPEDLEELKGLVQVFLAEKQFEGCGGLTVDDEMRVTIAAQACLLLLHRKSDMYPDLDSILVYPHAYRATGRHREGLLVVEAEEVRLGESWSRGSVILAWDHVLRGAHFMDDGHNVVLHEFAHQLDAEDGAVDGAPALGDRARYASWARVLGSEFAELVDEIHRGKASDIDAYGATSPPEFFAVATEMFFERPTALKRRHPDLYEQLASFYRQDPAEVVARAGLLPRST